MYGLPAKFLKMSVGELREVLQRVRNEIFSEIHSYDRNFRMGILPTNMSYTERRNLGYQEDLVVRVLGRIAGLDYDMTIEEVLDKGLISPRMAREIMELLFERGYI